MKKNRATNGAGASGPAASQSSDLARPDQTPGAALSQPAEAVTTPQPIQDTGKPSCGPAAPAFTESDYSV